MRTILIKWIIMTAAILIAAYIIDGIRISGFLPAFFAAAALGVLNAVFRPILLILTLPINILTLGLFTFLINALMLKMASGIIPGFDVIGFWPAVFGSLLISLVSWALNTIIRDAGSGNRRPPRVFRSGHRRSDVIDLDKKDGDRWE
jgi:putative membrane protein